MQTVSILPAGDSGTACRSEDQYFTLENPAVKHANTSLPTRVVVTSEYAQEGEEEEVMYSNICSSGGCVADTLCQLEDQNEYGNVDGDTEVTTHEDPDAAEIEYSNLETIQR